MAKITEYPAAAPLDGTEQTVIDQHGTTFSVTETARKNWIQGLFNSIYVGLANLASSSGSSLVGFIQAGTGAIARTIQSKERESVSVLDFSGVDPTGVTDSSAGILAAATYLNSIGGGVLKFPPGHYLITATITIPNNVTLDGGIRPGEILPGVSANYGAFSPTLVISSTATIQFANSSGCRGFIIIRQGLTLPFPDATTATAGVAAFAGTALTVGTGVVSTGFDVTYRDLLILGFNQAISCVGQSRTICDRVYGDCTNGILIQSSGDITRIDNCHFWPWTTVHQTWTTNALLRRSGTAYSFLVQVDWGKITDSFSYGYAVGIHVGGVNNVTLLGCGHDNTSTGGVGDNPGAIGILVDGSSHGTQIIGCQAAAQAQGIYINTSAGLMTNINNCLAHGTSSAGVYIAGGDAIITQGQFYSAVSAISIASATSNVEIDYNFFDLNTIDINCGVSTSLVKVGDHNNYGTLTSGTRPDNTNNIPIPITAASPLVLPTRGTDFAVSGNTSFGTITGGWTGREITLITSGTPTVFHSIGGNNIKLAGSINFTMAANYVLRLRYNGTQWFEISRNADIVNTPTYDLNGVLLASSTAPTIASGFGTSPSIVHANGTASFQINVGTGGTASSGVLTFPAAPNGWMVNVSWNGSSVNMNTYAVMTNTTTVTLTNQTSSTGATVAWPASTILNCTAFPL